MAKRTSKTGNSNGNGSTLIERARALARQRYEEEKLRARQRAEFLERVKGRALTAEEIAERDALQEPLLETSNIDGIKARRFSRLAPASVRNDPSYPAERDQLLGFFVDEALAKLRKWLEENEKHDKAPAVREARWLITRLDRFYLPGHIADVKHAELRAAVGRLKLQKSTAQARAARMLEAERSTMITDWFPLLGASGKDVRKRRLALGCIEHGLLEAGFAPRDVAKLIPDIESSDTITVRDESPRNAHVTRMRKRVTRFLEWVKQRKRQAAEALD